MLDRIALVTGNAGKAAEYAAMLGLEVIPAKAELTEIQSLDVAEVAARKAAANGYLATEPRGASGFGYDSIFLPGGDSRGRTYAQMTSEEKNEVSHRRRAVDAMRDALRLD